VLVVVVSAGFFCAQAPRLKALAKTATIMIAFKTLILFFTPFVLIAVELYISERAPRNEFLHHIQSAT
jgi:hypothetical protein